MHRSFWEAGYSVFGLHGVNIDGTCACGNPDCKAILKHPAVSNWQNTPVWSEEQIDFMEEVGQFATGYGVLCRGLLVVDIDARNGGVESYARLLERVPEVAAAGLIVNTGSGGGSKHLYFRCTAPLALMSHLHDYPGIDFRHGASFVVGPESLHASGRTYEVALGTPEDMEEVPEALVSLLRKPDRHRAVINGETVDVSLEELADMLGHVSGYDEYEQWVRVGMALHHASNGTAFDLWDQWSQRSDKYEGDQMLQKWNSFGKSANPVTLGTLVHYAQEGGWQRPVTFTAEVDFGFVDEPKLDASTIDLRRPPGFCGKLAEWIEAQGRRKRENLAALGAVFALGCVAGLKYTDDIDGVSTNLFLFNIAGSGTGKEAIQTAIKTILGAVGLHNSVHGSIKSEQEIYRNLRRQQAAIYLADEVGELLAKITNAQKRGGAVYLDAVIGTLMAAYSKANGSMLLTGDMKTEIRADLSREMAAVNKALDDGGPDWLHRKMASLEVQDQNLDMGFVRPFLAVAGYTTPVSFNDIMNYEHATNGFIGRSLIVQETDTAPRTKKNHRPPALPDRLDMALKQIFSAGSFDAETYPDKRMEYYGEKVKVPTSPEAHELLLQIVDIFDDKAVEHKSDTGLEALYLRAYELVSKVSLILAVPEGVRTVEHVRWAYALIERDIATKMHFVMALDREKDDPLAALRNKIMAVVGHDDGEAMGVIVNRCRKFKRPDVERAVLQLVEQGHLQAVEVKHPRNHKVVTKYRQPERG